MSITKLCSTTPSSTTTPPPLHPHHYTPLYPSGLWRVENAMQQKIAQLRDDLSKREQALRSMTGKVLLLLVTNGYSLAPSYLITPPLHLIISSSLLELFTT